LSLQASSRIRSIKFIFRIKFRNTYPQICKKQARCQWLMPVILVLGRVRSGGSGLEASFGKLFTGPESKITSAKQTGLGV
jgi:hypothetical protein